MTTEMNTRGSRGWIALVLINVASFITVLAVVSTIKTVTEFIERL